MLQLRKFIFLCAFNEPALVSLTQKIYSAIMSDFKNDPLTMAVFIFCNGDYD